MFRIPGRKTKKLHFINFQNGGTNIQRGFMHVMVNIDEHFINSLTVYGKLHICLIKDAKKHIILGFEENQ